MSFLYVGVGLHAQNPLGRARRHTEVVRKIYLGFCLSTTLMTPFNTLDNRAFCLTRSQFLNLEAANASFTFPPVEVIVIESSPEVDDVEPSYYDRMELKHWFTSHRPYDLRTRAGRKWKRDFIAAGFEFPVKIGQGIDYFL